MDLLFSKSCMFPFEARPAKERADQMFQAVLFQMRQAVSHPFVPRFAQTHFLEILRKTQILSDEDYIREGLAATLGTSDYALAEAREEIKRTNAFTFPDNRIIFRRTFVADDPYAPYFIHELLAEQMGYAYRKPVWKIPLASVSDGSLLIYPFQDKTDLINNLRKTSQDFYGIQTGLTIADFDLLTEGFMSLYKQRPDDQIYPIARAQRIFESTRAAMIQVLLESLYFGVNVSQEPPNKQFRLGWAVIRHNTQDVPELYIRERAVMPFIMRYWKRYETDKLFMGEVLNRLYDQNLEQFVRHLTKQERTDFFDGTKFIDMEFSNRTPVE